MKTFQLIVALTFFSFITTNAQITKGNWMMGGNISISKAESGSYSNNNSQTIKANRAFIDGTIGYYPIDRLAVGASPYFSWNNPEGSNNSGIGFGIGPFARYYYLKTENRYNIFTHVGYIYYNSYSQGIKNSYSNQFTIKNGVAVFLNSSVALEISVNYDDSKVNFESGSVTKFKDFNIGVGFQIHLEK